MEINLHGEFVLQLPHGGVGLQVRGVRLLGVGIERVQRDNGLSQNPRPVGGQEVVVGRDDGLNRRVLGDTRGDRDGFTCARRDFVAAASLGAHAQHDLTKEGVVAIRLVDQHRHVICRSHDGRKVLVVTITGGGIGMAMAADDHIHARRHSCQIGVHVGIHFDALGVFGEADVGQRDDRIVGGFERRRAILRLGDWVGEGQSWNVAGQLVDWDAMVADTQDSEADVLRTDGDREVRLDVHFRQPIAPVIVDVCLEQREVSLPERAGEDMSTEVVLVVTQRHRRVGHGIHRPEDRVDPELGGQVSTIGALTGEGSLVERCHRITLDGVTRVEQDRPLGVVLPFLPDQRGQVGVAGRRTGRHQSSMRIIVVQDGHRDDGSTGVIAFADDTTIQPLVVCRGWRAIVRAGPADDLIEHIAPVGDVGHVLEGGKSVLSGGRQEFVGADAVDAVHFQRFPGSAVLDLNIVSAPSPPGVVVGIESIGSAIAVVLEANTGNLQRALEERSALVEQLHDLGAGHIANYSLVAERQHTEQRPVGEGVGYGRCTSSDDVRSQTTGVVEDHVYVIEWFGVAVQLVVDCVVDEGAHGVIQGAPASQADIGVSNDCVDERQVVGILRPGVQACQRCCILFTRCGDSQ
ncbi:MAG: hypothetical protein BWY63_02218 [Chloroflexi bacterium ADurb.Bin360]|nr:MAG: hypothetical protein BWY63_02218 [Chloroflexi bacterium ADurb.Bin360]